ncbi:hypothetical protein DPMN_026427 [Dreissena polymorpha]|uniref:Uncharacterized protein n=1 Tax=Dreissena polymorpha TaxID=45954 RepID=A0A9D4LRM8_DREPO|nr:hypothetical protein DPMN_026427 [Dreissena polymorpha]
MNNRRTNTLNRTFQDICETNKDYWAAAFRSRLEIVSDLPAAAADAVYRQMCNINFRTNKAIPVYFKQENLKKASHPQEDQETLMQETHENIGANRQTNRPTDRQGKNNMSPTTISLLCHRKFPVLNDTNGLKSRVNQQHLHSLFNPKIREGRSSPSMVRTKLPDGNGITSSQLKPKME